MPRLLTILIGLLIFPVFLTEHAAGQEPLDEMDIELSVSEGETLDLPRPAGTILLADPELADIQTVTDTRFFLLGKAPGRTKLIVLDEEGEEILMAHINIIRSLDELRRVMAEEIGEYPVQVTYTDSGAIITGTVPTVAKAKAAVDLVKAFAGKNAEVLNRLKVTGGQQVNLRVRVAEISRNLTNSLGIDWSAVGQIGDFAIGLSTGTAITGAIGDILSDATGGRAAVRFSDNGGTSVTGIIDALANDGLVTILAQPNLTAESGEEATFFSGGEFPIPVSQGEERVTTEFRRFGISLSFVPIVLSNDTIRLQVNPEVSELSQVGAVSANGFNIPSVTNRSVKTTVTMASGQSFAIAGLIRDNFSTSIRKVPGLGDLPVLGPLFRSSSFQRLETELVIIITPYIVEPIVNEKSVKAPTDLIRAPTGLEMILFGDLGKGDDFPQYRLHGDAGFMLE